MLGLSLTLSIGDGMLRDAAHERTWRTAARTADNIVEPENKTVGSKSYSHIYDSLGLDDTGKFALDLTTQQLRDYSDLVKK